MRLQQAFILYIIICKSTTYVIILKIYIYIGTILKKIAKSYC
jgi:hypothetical protein